MSIVGWNWREWARLASRIFRTGVMVTPFRGREVSRGKTMRNGRLKGVVGLDDCALVDHDLCTFERIAAHKRECVRTYVCICVSVYSHLLLTSIMGLLSYPFI